MGILIGLLSLSMRGRVKSMRVIKEKNSIKKRKSINWQSKTKLIIESILTQSIVNAYQIIDEKKRIESENLEKQEEDNKNLDKEKWYINLYFMLNVLVFPRKIHKRFKINNQIYDSILVLFVSFVLGLFGSIIRLVGVYAFGCGLKLLFMDSIDCWNVIKSFSLAFLALLFGSLFILSGEEFSKVSDSNRIYAYSSCIIALLGCIIAVISIIISQ